MENLLRFGYDDTELITGLRRSEAAVDSTLSRMQSRLETFNVAQASIGRAPGTSGNVGFGQTSTATFNIAGNASRELEALTTRSEQFSRSLDKVTKQFSGGLGLGLSLGGFALFEGVLERSIQKARQFETAQISIAAAMSSISKRIDTSNGRTLSGSDNFSANMVEAGRIRADILAKSGRTILTFQEQLQAFQSSINPGARKGLSVKDTEEVSQQSAIVAKTLGLRGEQLANASRLLLGGGVNIARSTIGRALGIDNTDIATRHGKELKSFLLERMSGFKDAEDAFANSIEGQMSTIESRIDAILAKAGTSFLKKVSPVLQNLFSGVEDPQERPGESKDDFDKRVKDHAKSAEELEQVVDSLSAAFTGVFKAIQTVVQSDAFAAFAHFLEGIAGYADKIVLAAIFFKIADAIKGANGQLTAFVAAMGEMTGGALLSGLRTVGTPAAQALARDLNAARVTQAAQTEQAAVRQAIDTRGPLYGPSPTAQALGYESHAMGTNFGRYMNRQEQNLIGETSHWDGDMENGKYDRHMTLQQMARLDITQAEARLRRNELTRRNQRVTIGGMEEEGSDFREGSTLTDLSGVPQENIENILRDRAERKHAAETIQRGKQFLKENPIGFTDNNAGIKEASQGDTIFGALPGETQKDYVKSVREEADRHKALTKTIEDQRQASLTDIAAINTRGKLRYGLGAVDENGNSIAGAPYSQEDYENEIEARKLTVNSRADSALRADQSLHEQRRASVREEIQNKGAEYQARNMSMDRQDRARDNFASSIEQGVTNTYNNPASGIATGEDRKRLIGEQRKAYVDFKETHKAAMLEFEPLSGHIASGAFEGEELEQALARQSNLASVISKSEAGMSNIHPEALPFMEKAGLAGRNLAENTNKYGQFVMLGVMAGSAINDKADEQENDISRYGGRFLGGALQGGSTGALLGSVVPGVGTVAGGVVGAVAGGGLSMLTGEISDLGKVAARTAKDIEDAKAKFPVFAAKEAVHDAQDERTRFQDIAKGGKPGYFASPTDQLDYINSKDPEFMKDLDAGVTKAQQKLKDLERNTLQQDTVDDTGEKIKSLDGQVQAHSAFADTISKKQTDLNSSFEKRRLELEKEANEKNSTIIGYSEADYLAARKKEFQSLGGEFTDDDEKAYRGLYAQKNQLGLGRLYGDLKTQQTQEARGEKLQESGAENTLEGNSAVSQILSKVAEVESYATKYADKGGVNSTEYQQFATQAFSEIYKNAQRDLRTSGLELQDTALTNRKQQVEDYYTIKGVPRQEESLRLSVSEAMRNIDSVKIEAAEVQLSAAELKINGEKLGLRQDELNLKRDQFNSRSTALIDADAPAHLSIKARQYALQHETNLADMVRIGHEIRRLPIEQQQITEDRQQQLLAQRYAAREHPLTEQETQIKYRQADREAYSAAQGDKQTMFYGGLGPVSDAASAIRYGVEAKYARNFNPKAYAAAYDRSLQNQVANMGDEAQLAQINKARAAIALDKVETDYAQSVSNAARAMDALTERSYALAMKQGDLGRSLVSAGLKDTDEGMTNAEEQAKGAEAIARRPLERDFERRNLGLEQRGLDIDRDKYGLSARKQALTEAGLPDKIEASRLNADAARDAYAKYVAEEPLVRGTMAVNQQRAREKFDKQTEDYQDKQEAVDRLKAEIPNTINLNAVIKDERTNAQDRAELKAAIQKGVDDGIAAYVKNCERRNKIN